MLLVCFFSALQVTVCYPRCFRFGNVPFLLLFVVAIGKAPKKLAKKTAATTIIRKTEIKQYRNRKDEQKNHNNVKTKRNLPYLMRYWKLDINYVNGSKYK